MTSTSTLHLDDERISSWLAGADDAELEMHLRECDACNARVQSDARDDVELRALRGHVALCPACHSACNADDDERCLHCGLAFRPGGYVVEALLASHGPSRLYRARGEDGALVALKELSFATVPDVSALDAFDREANMLRQLRHPSIPRFISSFHEGSGVHERLYLVQELIDGTSLKDELASTRFDEARARAVADEVLSILVHLQSLSPAVIHRDIKPQNLLVRRDGGLVLVDFGSARETAGTAGGSLVGTFGYMPPEQLTGIVDGSSDVYALAATVVHLLSRRPPWENILDGGWQKSVHVSPRFVAFLEKCLSFRAHDRFVDAATALAALRALDHTKAARRFSLARGVAIAAAALVAIGGVGGIATAIVQSTPASTPAPSTSGGGEPSMSPETTSSELGHFVRFAGSRFHTPEGEVQITYVLVQGDGHAAHVRVRFDADHDLVARMAGSERDLLRRVAVIHEDGVDSLPWTLRVDGESAELEAQIASARALLILGDTRQVALDRNGVDLDVDLRAASVALPAAMRDNGKATFVGETGLADPIPRAVDGDAPAVRASGPRFERAFFERALRAAIEESGVNAKIAMIDCDVAPCVAVGRLYGKSDGLQQLLHTTALAPYADDAVAYYLYGVEEPEHPFALAYFERATTKDDEKAARARVDVRLHALLKGSAIIEGKNDRWYE
jgi:serine/threonine protein kinase